MSGSEYSGNSELVILVNTIRQNRRWRLNMQMSLHHLVSRKRQVLDVCFLLLLLISNQGNNITTNKSFFSFVSRCNYVWCISRRFDCILLVFFRRWGRLVMHDPIKHDALLWLVVFSTALIGAFRSLLFTQWFAPSAVRCRTALLFLFFLSWASTLLEFLFHYPCWCCQGEVLYELPLWLWKVDGGYFYARVRAIETKSVLQPVMHGPSQYLYHARWCNFQEIGPGQFWE